MTNLTLLLDDLARGRAGAAEDLFPIIYEELRALAGAFFREERSEHTLQPTALVHEAYLRMAQPSPDGPRTSVQFRALAATVMRHVLVDHARARNALRRGGDRTLVSLGADVASAGSGGEVDVEAIDQALQELSGLNERTARVVELRFFAGLSHEEIAESLGVSLSSVEREWRFARSWLADRLSAGRGG